MIYNKELQFATLEDALKHFKIPPQSEAAGKIKSKLLQDNYAEVGSEPYLFGETCYAIESRANGYSVISYPFMPLPGTKVTDPRFWKGGKILEH